MQCAGPVAVIRCVDRVELDWPCDSRALAAAREAARERSEPPQDAARDTAVQPLIEPFGEPIDDFEEATEADALAADAFAAEEETTTVRPSPIPPELVAWNAGTDGDAGGARPAQPRGRIGKYELSTRLARGAFGVVYTARDPSLDRNVAIKVLRLSHLANQEIVQRFLQEARATARIAHPGIVMIHDYGMVQTRRGSTAFIAMELLSGESLSRRLARMGRLPPAAACEIVRQVASALEAAHHVAVLHRDLKPDNIFLVPDPAMPSGERVKVLDFGLAKLGPTGRTQLEMVFGTPRYMSPEQSRSATQIDHRSDIYSLGCVLFELVTGCTPFEGDARQLLERHQRGAPPRVATRVPEVPPVLDELIADMLAKDPSDRPQSMGAVQRVLRFAVHGGPSTGAEDGPTAPDPARVPPQRLGSVGGPAVSHPPPPSGSPRPPTPPARPAVTSIEISMSSFPALPLPPPPAATTRGPGESGSGESVSGEIVLPAVAVCEAERVPDAAPAGWSEAPDRRHRLLFYLCVATIAVSTAVALVVA